MIFKQVIIISVLLAGCGLGAGNIDKFLFDTSGDLTLNSNDDENLELSLAPNAVGRDGRLKLTPRKHFREVANYVLYNRKPFKAYIISLQVEFMPNTGDQYILGTAKFFLRYIPSRKALEYGVNNRKWTVVSSDRQKIQVVPGKKYDVAISSDGIFQTIAVNGVKSSLRNEFVPQFNKILLGSCGWGKRTDWDLDGIIDNLSFEEIQLQYSDNIPEAKPDPDTIALFNFGKNSSKDEAGKGASVILGPHAKVDRNRGGSLRLDPRKDATDAKTLLKHPLDGKPLASFSIEADLCIDAPGTFAGDSYFICGRFFFIRFAVDRRSFEFGLNVNGKWNVAKTVKKDFMPRPNKWYKIKCDYNNGVMRLSIDGRQYDSKKIKGPVKLSTFVLGSIAWSNRKPSAEHNGWLDSIKLNAKLAK